MFRHMLLGLGAASLLVVVTAMPVQALPFHYPDEPPIDRIVTRSTVTFGILEWVWASPISGGNQSSVELIHGFKFASFQQWTESFSDRSALLSAFDGGAKCAALYFSNEVTFGDPLGEQCQDGDVRTGGLVYGAPYPAIALNQAASENLSSDVFLYREYTGPSTALPEPSSLLLLGAGLLGLAAWRWKHTA